MPLLETRWDLGILNRPYLPVNIFQRFVGVTRISGEFWLVNYAFYVSCHWPNEVTTIKTCESILTEPDSPAKLRSISIIKYMNFIKSRWVGTCNSHTKPMSRHIYRLIYFYRIPFLLWKKDSSGPANLSCHWSWHSPREFHFWEIRSKNKSVYKNIVTGM